MTQTQFRFILAILLVITAAVLRVFITIPNVTPIGAMALMSGALLQRRFVAYFIPLSALFISDAVLGFYNPLLMAGVYGAFILTVWIGSTFAKKVVLKNVIVSSIFSSISFFIVTNFFVWLEGILYPRTIEGLAICYLNAIPFFRYELAGTLGFSLLFFGVYYMAFRMVSSRLRAEDVR